AAAELFEDGAVAELLAVAAGPLDAGGLGHVLEEGRTSRLVFRVLGKLAGLFLTFAATAGGAQGEKQGQGQAAAEEQPGQAPRGQRQMSGSHAEVPSAKEQTGVPIVGAPCVGAVR